MSFGILTVSPSLPAHSFPSGANGAIHKILELFRFYKWCDKSSQTNFCYDILLKFLENPC